MLRADPAKGTGKPEALKHTLTGLWSRRISPQDRLIHNFYDDDVYVFAIGGHYERLK
jgi:toxin YoeB